MRFYTVGYVYSDETTPRDEHFRTVKAVDADEAKKEVQFRAILNGDRIQVTNSMTNS